MIHMKDDGLLLVNLFRLYSLHNVTQQLVTLGALVKKYKVKNVALLGGLMDRGNDDDSGQSDYNEDDFKDLMSLQQVQQSIKVYYDRLKELINPIDEERLKLDSVHQIKSIVGDFYKKKNS